MNILMEVRFMGHIQSSVKVEIFFFLEQNRFGTLNLLFYLRLL